MPEALLVPYSFGNVVVGSGHFQICHGCLRTVLLKRVFHDGCFRWVVLAEIQSKDRGESSDKNGGRLRKGFGVCSDTLPVMAQKSTMN